MISFVVFGRSGSASERQRLKKNASTRRSKKRGRITGGDAIDMSGTDSGVDANCDGGDVFGKNIGEKIGDDFFDNSGDEFGEERGENGGDNF